jgi:hypothetical protein
VSANNSPGTTADRLRATPDPGVRAARALVVRTTRQFSCPASAVWPLLCDSRMDGPRAPLFRLGVPQPIQCRLPGGEGGVGRERECVSDQGVVHQRIFEWVPEQRLSFRMESSDIPFATHIDEMVDRFDLVAGAKGVEVTRRTSFSPKGPLRLLRGWFFALGIKQVHRYVFRNWDRLTRSVPGRGRIAG